MTQPSPLPPENCRLFLLVRRGVPLLGAALMLALAALEPGGRGWYLLGAVARNQEINRELAIETLGGATAIRCWYRLEPYLKAENPAYPKLVPVEQLMIQGVFRALIRQVDNAKHA